MKDRFRRLLCLALALCLTAGLAGCRETSAPDQQESGEEEEYIQIGMTFDSFVIERWRRDQDIFVSTAQDLGARVYVQNANGNVEEQIDQVEYFIEKQMDAIVIIAVDCYAMSDVVQKARDAGIVVVAYDRMIEDASLDLYISFDNEAVGRMMAETLAENLDPGSSIICITGPDSDSNVAEVAAGFQSVLERRPLRVEYTRSAEGWLAETAYAGVEEALDLGIQFSGIMCGNDDLASQAFQALSEHRLAGSVCLVGQDADLAACQRIVEGTQAMTVYKPVEKLARTAAEYTIRLVQGEELGLETQDNGWGQIPTQLIEPVKVTADNMKEVIIDGGFHLEDEVYLNLNEKERESG
ncbi:MAG: substrate-binding domain-containing protein [Candidatus Onthomonas sp.]